MLFYDAVATSPRRVRMFVAEKGLNIPKRTVDLAKREHFTAELRAKNPRCTVPILELDDGTCLWDTLAICEYLETTHPDPALFGAGPLDHARVVMWFQRIEQDGFASVADAFRNAHPFFKDHALVGAEQTPQIPELVARGRARIASFHRDMNMRLGESKFVAGDFFSFADIQLLCV